MEIAGKTSWGRYFSANKPLAPLKLSLVLPPFNRDLWPLVTEIQEKSLLEPWLGVSHMQIETTI